MATKRKTARDLRPAAVVNRPAALRKPEGSVNVASNPGDKLSEAVLLKLRDGPKRLSRLTRELTGVSQRSLILVLRRLEREGLVTSTMFASIPPRVEWELTRAGHGLFDASID